MNKRRNLLAGFAVFGMVFALLLAAMLTACDPIEGNIDEIRQKAEGGRYVPPPDTTVYYTVTFESNGGTSVPSQTVKAGDPVPRPVPTKTDWIFSNWYSDVGLTQAYNFSTPVNAHITLYASWVSPTAAKYRVTFNSNGGSSVPYQDVYENERAVRPDNPTRNGYNFDNWYIDTSFNVLFGFSDEITAATTAYAKWIAYCEVKYNSNDGMGSMANTTYHDGTTQALRTNTFTRRGYNFAGWTTESNGSGASYTNEQIVSYTLLGATPGKVVDLYARWNLLAVPAGTLAQKLAWIAANAGNGVDYTVTIDDDESLGPQTLTTSPGEGCSNYQITLSGSGAVRTVTLSKAGSMFTINSGVTLMLGSNITLQGRSVNINSLVLIAEGGELVMNSGSTITGNSNASTSYGGGVYVAGKLAMKTGSAITNNRVTVPSESNVFGGGVYVAPTGTFTMEGGTISGNRAYTSTTKGTFNPYGGGVFIFSGGSFIKTGASVIYGEDGDSTTRNTAMRINEILPGRGQAVNVNRTKYRDTTAGSGVDLDSSTSANWGE